MAVFLSSLSQWLRGGQAPAAPVKPMVATAIRGSAVKQIPARLLNFASMPFRPRHASLPKQASAQALFQSGCPKPLAECVSKFSNTVNESIPEEKKDEFRRLLQNPLGLAHYGIGDIRPNAREANCYYVKVGGGVLERTEDELWRHAQLEQKWLEMQSPRPSAAADLFSSAAVIPHLPVKGRDQPARLSPAESAVIKPNPHSSTNSMRPGRSPREAKLPTAQSQAAGPIPIDASSARRSGSAIGPQSSNGGRTLFEAIGRRGEWQNPVISIFKDMIDIPRFKACLEQTHQIRRISGHRQNCWMRSAWVASLPQIDPDQLGQRLLDKLGTVYRAEDLVGVSGQPESGAMDNPTLEADIAEVVALARGVQARGIDSILDERGELKPSGSRRLDRSKDCANALEKKIERITLALLNRRMDALDAATERENQRLWARGRPPLPLIDREPVVRSVKGTDDGENFYIETLMQELGADCACVSSHCDPMGNRTDSVQLSLQAQSSLRQLRLNEAPGNPRDDATRQQNAEWLNAASTEIPYIEHCGTDFGGHFNVFFPRGRR